MLKKSGMPIDKAFHEALRENGIEFKPLAKNERKKEITLVDIKGNEFHLNKNLKVKKSNILRIKELDNIRAGQTVVVVPDEKIGCFRSMATKTSVERMLGIPLRGARLKVKNAKNI